ncbi:MAG: M1 family metallopeptidase [Bacteroidota bacterium]|nr:M1 family metallopeptidase [Bacteroidota bacterium]MDP4216446.1 M1 family metallopeptidase [Bacteroidota bacterium]MDP4246305.1 M1 family metallopeptidase [Bacteroidota bacterium]MDP4252426.1 M1 family metallopeptidase [Bacteroidota bacterium]MDP4258604.1 M1 family metallopeptidase [Bacteroidota bacterium]
MNKQKERFLLILAGCGFCFTAWSGPHAGDATGPAPSPAYWQQELHYSLQVTLDDRAHSLQGVESLDYVNHSPDTLSFIWFHLWPNAYKDNSTALFRQLATLEDRKEKLKKVRENGYINGLAFTVDGQPAATQAHPKYNDVVKLLLPAMLAPGARIRIATPFFVKIPSYFSRLGHEGHSYMITQWYPKPAVYDRQGWHEFPYLDQGEFYSEFGSFDVHITLPSAYVVGATGELQTGDELARYRTIGKANLADSANPAGFTAYRATDPAAMKTLDYHGENIHDFAWFADKSLFINYDTLRLPSGRVIDVFSYYRSGAGRQWLHSISFIKDAVLHYSDWVGEYGYPVVSAVEGPGNVSSGGMEYPMITLITSPGASKDELDGVIAHEVGHNWFYGMLGSNEREHPWMDEGINSYYEFLYEAEKYRTNSALGNLIPRDIRKKGLDDFLDAVYAVFNQVRTDEPIETPATGFRSESEYGLVEYARTAVWMYILQKAMGQEDFKKGMRNYFTEWKFRHPYPEDLKASLEEVTHEPLDNVFALLNKSGSF